MTYTFTTNNQYLIYPVVIEYNNGPNGDNGGNGSATYNINFASGQWAIGSVNVKAKINGQEVTDTRRLGLDDEIELVGFDSNTMKVKVSASDGFNCELTVDDQGKTKLANKQSGNLPDGTLVFNVQAKNSGDGGNQGGPDQGPHYDSVAKINFTGNEYITDEFGKNVVISINGSNPVSLKKGQVNNVEYNKNAEGNNAGKIEIEIGTLYINYFDKITIDGNEHDNPIQGDALENTFRNESVWYTEVLTEKSQDSQYTIDVSLREANTNNGEIKVGNFLWTTDETRKYQLDQQGNPITGQDGNPVLNDDYLDHGDIEIVGLKIGNNYYGSNDLNSVLKSGSSKDWSAESPGKPGGATFPVGSELTVALKPEYGYQLTNFTINGGTFQTGDNVSEFTFEIKPGSFHLGAIFTKVEDAVLAEAEAVESGEIVIGDHEIDSGSVVLNVDEAHLTAEQISNFESARGANNNTYTISSFLDISLNQVIYKGNESDMWTVPLGKENELNEEATITLKLEDGVNGNEIVIIHETHDGEYEIIPATYNAANNTITFRTKSFSNYAIGTARNSGNGGNNNNNNSGGSVRPAPNTSVR